MLELIKAMSFKRRTTAFFLYITLILAIIIAGWFGWLQYKNTEVKFSQAVILAEEQARAAAELQVQLNVSRGNAEALRAAYEREKNKPATTFFVQGSTLPVAASQVQERINSKDRTLPPVVLEQADRTAVVANETEFKVDVLKINLDKARLGFNVLVLAGDGMEIGVGPSWKNRDNAINAGATTKKRAYFMATHYF